MLKENTTVGNRDESHTRAGSGGRHAAGLALFGLGFISISAQIYILRESFEVFYGNEMILGIMLSVWMLMTGIGAILGKFSIKTRDPGQFLLFLMLILSLLPSLMIVKMDLYRAVVLPSGAMAGINDVVYAAFLIQLPFCLINGFLFTSLSGIAGNAGQAYSIESLGQGWR